MVGVIRIDDIGRLGRGGGGVFSQAPLSEMITEYFRVWARNFSGFGHGRAASVLTCPA